MNVPGMVGELEQPKPLSRAERWRLTRKLVGPSACLGLILYSWLRDRIPPSVALTGGILLFFLFATWVVRLTVRMDFTGFRLLVIRGDGREATRTMSYRESLSVAWLMCWRSSLLILPLVAAASLLPPESHGGWIGYLWSSWHGWLWFAVAELLILYVWTVEAALGKRYSGFSLRLDRSAPKNA